MHAGIYMIARCFSCEHGWVHACIPRRSGVLPTDNCIKRATVDVQIARQHAEGYCRQTLGYAACNMDFVQGHMELLEKAGIEEGAYDLIISNCVVNLSPDKGAVLRGAYRALAPGGEMYFSDVYCDRRVPEEARKDEVCSGESSSL